MYLPVYVAIETGEFHKRGLNVVLSLVGNDDEVFTSVASGEADFGVSDPTFCAMKLNELHQVKVIATVANRVGLWGITHNPVISAIKKPEDMVNLRIGCFPRPSTSYALVKRLKASHKRLLGSLDIVEAPIGQQFGLLAKDQADIVMDIEPFISIAESKGSQVVYSYPDWYGPCIFTGLMTKAATIKTQPEVCASMVQGLQAALTHMHRDPGISLKVSQQLFPDIEADVLQNSVDRVMQSQAWGATSDIDQVAWRNAIAVRESIGDVFVQDIDAAVTNQFCIQA